MVNSCKFLGVHLNKRLDWTDNTEALYKKGQSRLFFLRRLRSFDVCSRLLRIFYQSMVASALLVANAGETNKPNKLVSKASSFLPTKTAPPSRG